MSGFLGRRRWFVIGAWIVVLVAAVPLAARQTENLSSGGFDVPGSGSAVAAEAVEERFPGGELDRIGAILKAEGQLDEAAASAALARLEEDVSAVEGLTIPAAAREQATAQLVSEGLAIVPISSSLSADEVNTAASDLREAIAPGEPVDGVIPYLTGQAAVFAGLQEVSKEGLERAETAGFPIIALILVAVFGSLAAASLPLILGFAAVVITGGVIWLLSQQMEMSVFVTNMASMVGIGVAVDYSLFVLARYREELRAGLPVEEARAAAMSTSGLAVAFSGLAVIIALAGLWMVDNQALRSMALGAMVVVAIAILAATVLLPAMLRVLGHRVEAGGFAWRISGLFRRAAGNRRRMPGASRGETTDFWTRWTDRIMRRPWLALTVSASILLALALPALAMKTGTGALDQFAAGHDVQVSAALQAELNGGETAALDVVATFDEADPRSAAGSAALSELASAIRRDPGVRAVGEPEIAGDAALIDVTAASSIEADASYELVTRLREEIVPASEAATLAEVSVGGETARMNDVRDQISGSMWKIAGFILGFSFLVLMVMLRSVLLPLKAVIMNLLSIGAAYGILVMIFQWGILDGFLGFNGLGALDTINVPLILAVVFGLSMDYEVFLLSRIRERYAEHGDNRRAVAEGLRSSARTISSAALIMTSVFAIFVFTGVPSIKEIGLGNAVAVALDATLVRLVLVPAAMALMGDWNWWMPKWLDRIIPDLDFEGRRKPEAGTVGPPAEATS